MCPGASMSPDSGTFPFYVWSLADLSTTYLPSLFAGGERRGHVFTFHGIVLTEGGRWM